MSGGSFNYLYCREVDDMVDRDDTDLADMRAELTARPGAALAVEGIDMLRAQLLILRQEREAQRLREREVDAFKGRLNDVFRAVEWWRSADWGEDRVVEALVKLNEQGLK